MSLLPRRTTRQDRRLVLILLVIATAISALSLLTMATDAGPVLMFPAAAFAIVTGSLAARRARVTQGRAFLAERIVLTPIIWLGLIARTLHSMGLPFAGGDSAADVGVVFLGGTWAWAGLGAAVFGVKRLYEREAAIARLARRRGSRPAARWVVPVLPSAAAVAIVAPLPNLRADPVLTVAAALLTALGALFISSGFPSGVRSRLGRVLLLVGALALAVSVTPFAAYWAEAFVSDVTWDPWVSTRPIAQWLGLAGSYALVGAWLLFYRPFADHEWRLARSSEPGVR